jgi:predicted NAD/FAD-dependent oxidoreductase
MGGEQGFPAGQLGSFSRKFELATFRSTETVAADRSLGEIRINGADVGKGLFQEQDLRVYESWGKGGAGGSARLWQEEGMQIAVIGAGISGLVCARRLMAGGHQVVVMEKSRSLGGRCATRKFGDHVVDTGVQYFTLRDEEVRKEVEEAAGDHLRKLEKPILVKGEIYRSGEERFYLAPGNNRLGAFLAEGLEVKREMEVAAVSRINGKWSIAGGEYDVVISSAPWPQTAGLFGLEKTTTSYDPNLTVLLEYKIPWNEAAYAKMDPDGKDPLAWVACENAKAGRIQEGRAVYVIQASADYSRENLEKKPEDWILDLQLRFEKQWGMDPVQRGAVFGHRWRYARRESRVGQSDALPEGLYVCGDSLVDSRLESVWKSGKETARKILDSRT